MVERRIELDRRYHRKEKMRKLKKKLATGAVRVAGVYDEGKINDLPRFVDFLKKPLEEK